MLSIDEIEKTIIELEQKDTTFSVMERLAPLYIVHDHLKGFNASPEATLKMAQSSEFAQAVNGKPPEKVMEIIDELMETIKMLHRGVYNQVISQIKKL